MKISATRWVKWGAFVVELYVLFVLYTCVFMVPFPYNEKLGIIGGAMAVSGAFAVLSSSMWKDSEHDPRPSLWKIPTKPPFGLWAFATFRL